MLKHRPLGTQNKYQRWRTMRKNSEKKQQTVCERWEKFDNYDEDTGPLPQDNARIVLKPDETEWAPDTCVWQYTDKRTGRRATKQLPSSCLYAANRAMRMSKRGSLRLGPRARDA